jgi:hypothetical protein
LGVVMGYFSSARAISAASAMPGAAFRRSAKRHRKAPASYPRACK